MIRAPSRFALHCVALFSLSLAGCGDDSQQRLMEALGKEGIKSITVGDAKVTATCASGSTAEVDTSELERNFLGMVKSERVRVVANKLYKECDEKDSAKRKAESAKAAIGDAAKQLGIDISALDDAGAKKAICDKLITQLPLKDPDRTVEDAKNQNKWGCAPAPPVSDLPTGAWQPETPAPDPKTKKPVTSYLRLQTDEGQRLTIRCAAKKADVYLQTADLVKKGTKTVDATLGGAKPAKWKVKPSTDGKAIFFVDVKPTIKAMESADVVVLAVAGNKKIENVSLKTKGLGESIKKFPKECQ